ncbi:MAG: rod shape-determining protein RodA [Bacillota bacterium]|nr:rod shape-determining protein RodA [Bacillota bacterium]HOP70090.1 rod shape-determining protein RodA [Bacillota bacterium]HPT35433.1 rod shape-determining protein RodA [Bacillota bacterium]HPZ84847.1 rod shape-determining protein RodA [Bacillota bacterium]HQD85403.1 rod shape-determining protein RodA [Bacillota bacterium]
MDFWLLGAVLFLEILSLPLIDSATHSTGGHYYLKRQLLLVVLSLLMMGVATFIDYRDLVWLSPWILGVNTLLLVAVLFVGRTAGGSTRWISLGFFDLQPSELFKLTAILFATRVLCSLDRPVDSIFSIVAFYSWLAVPAFLILKQPDLGTTLVIIAIVTGMLYFAGTPAKSIFSLVLVGIIIVGLLLWLYLYVGVPLPIEEHWIDRLVTGFNPEKDPLGKGYQVLQSKIAIGSGSVWGKGLGKGTQNRLDFIPHQETDFIFSVVGEELGFVRTTIVLGVYVLILIRCLIAAVTSADKEGTLIAGGVLSMLLFQSMVNIGMTMGIMPVTGIPLPFLSYGGTASVVNAFAIGLVLNVGWKRHKILF